MAASTAGRTLEQTPTWAVAIVCFVLVVVSIFIEHIIHLIGQWLKKKRKTALYESLEKIKSELMLLGFISLLLTVGQGLILKICIPASVGATWHPCNKNQEIRYNMEEGSSSNRKLLSFLNPGNVFRRELAASSGTDKCSARGKVPFISSEAINQLHFFIFVLAVFHVLYSVITMALSGAKMKSWEKWERETRTAEYKYSHDPERLRFTRETSFGRRHLSFWSKTPFIIWMVCFFRQFIRSVTKVDYLTLRHGFIMAHLAPQSQTNFNFQKYINRSLEADFKVVVSISPPIWFLAVLFLLFNTHGWYSYLWLPFIPLIIILMIGTKLQVIITKMGLRIQDRGEVVKGVPVVQPGDDLFWFNYPRLMLYLINFVLFQNAFQLAFFAWSWYEFGMKSCFHEYKEDVIIRISMGVLIQILCSYVTLPLYALVTQMGSTMKPTIFNEKVATALRNWHLTAKKKLKQSKSGTMSSVTTPMSSMPATPTHSMSPFHLLRGLQHHHRSDMDSLQSPTSPSCQYYDQWRSQGDIDRSSSSHKVGFDNNVEQHDGDMSFEQKLGQVELITQEIGEEHKVDIVGEKDFSFDKRKNSV